MKLSKIAVLILILTIVILNILIINYFNYGKLDNLTIGSYNPLINPQDFSNVIDNKYLTFKPKTKFTYEGITEEGLERVEVYVTEETRMVMGIDALVVWDRVWLENELIEDTKDWYAQDKEGNVWYFGEESYEYVLGEVVNNAGSWEAGINGAKPGIVMKANPEVGEIYRQEYFKGEAEDMAEIISLNEQVSVPYGIFNNCLKTKDWTPLEINSDENKYYCKQIGNVVLEVVLEDGEQVKLVSIEYNAEPSPENLGKSVNKNSDKLSMKITEEMAKAIALKEVPGLVTDVEIENKKGKKAYVIEIDADNGPETDVIIDFETGEVLGIET